MSLLSLENISLAFGLDLLLDHVKLQINEGERICLIGRNGAGKSSFLKILEGVMQPDGGQIWRQTHLRVARLAQELPQQATGTVYEFVAEGLVGIGELLAKYHALIQKPDMDLLELEKLQQEIDAKNAWTFEQDINTILTRLELSPDVLVSELSGGWQRRAALARALVVSPDILLLDEPTNHLDVSAIQWLEDYLFSCNIAIVFITHDRSLLQRLATRIIELDRGQLTSWPGDYQNFLRRKEEMLHAEAKQNAEFDKKLAQEEKWIRQGIKARRTRNEGRVRALEALRRTRSERRELQGKVSFNLQEADKSGQLVVEAKNISQIYRDQPVIKNFSVRIMRGDRIGLIGPNGIGKSTLLNLLLGNIEPQQGTVTLGTKLQIAYFDQLRAALDLEKTVAENVALGRDFIEINGKRQHIVSYLNDFLFTPQRSLTPVKALSGGECNRLLLAKLFSQPANVLVLDEPTNDLDIETLELLEELLTEFKGTLLIVSHDRTFLDNVVTSTLVFEGEGKIQEFIGGYQDWLRQRSVETKPQTIETSKIEKPTDRKKLSYKEQKELADLPLKIEQLEKEQKELQQLISDPDFYKKNATETKASLSRMQQIEAELTDCFQRWEQLEDKK